MTVVAVGRYDSLKTFNWRENLIFFVSVRGGNFYRTFRVKLSFRRRRSIVISFLI